MSIPKVSFIVPIYHIGEALLGKCLESLLNQTMEEIEILLVDDGSTEADARTCDLYVQKDSRVRVFHKKNEGVSVARNHGIEHARGKYVVFVDPDDTVDHRLAELCYECCMEHKAELILYKSSFNLDRSKPHNTRKVERIPQDEYALISTKVISMKDEAYDYGSCWGKMIDREFLLHHHLYFVPGVKKAQDRIFMFDCYQKVKHAYKLDYVGYIYYDENLQSICHRYNPNIISILENTAGEFHRHIKPYNREDYIRAEYIMSIRFLYEYLQLYILHKENTKGIREKRKDILALAGKGRYAKSLRMVKLRDIPMKCAVVCLFFRFRLYLLLTLFGSLYLNKKG